MPLWGGGVGLIPAVGFGCSTMSPHPHRRSPGSWGRARLCPGTHPGPRLGLGYKLKFNFIKPVSSQSLALANNAGQGASSSAAVTHSASPALVRKLLEQHFPPKFMELAASGA